MTMETALQRRDEIFQTPKNELVNRLANKLVENEIVEDDSEHTLFESWVSTREARSNALECIKTNSAKQ